MRKSYNALRWKDVKKACYGSHCWIVGKNTNPDDLGDIRNHYIFALDDAIVNFTRFNNVFWIITNEDVFRMCYPKISLWRYWYIILQDTNEDFIKYAPWTQREYTMSITFNEESDGICTQYSAFSLAVQAVHQMGFRVLFLLGIDLHEEEYNFIRAFKSYWTTKFVKTFDCDKKYFTPIDYNEALLMSEKI